MPTLEPAAGIRSPSIGLNATTVFAAAAAFVPLVAALAPLGIAPLGAILALVSSALLVSGRLQWPNFSAVPVVILGGFLAWSATSILWAIEPARAAETAFRTTLIVCGGSLLIALAAQLNNGDREPVRKILSISVAVTVTALLGITLYQLFIPRIDQSNDAVLGFLAAFNRTASVIAILIWPACAVLGQWSRYGAILLFCLATSLLVLLNPSSPVLAVGFGAVAFGATYLQPRLAACLLAGGIALVTAMTPFAGTLTPSFGRAVEATHHIDGSLNHRLLIWEFAAQRAGERPLTGWGLEASRVLGDDATTKVTVDDSGIQRAAELLPLHPHNALLQIWLELGLPGAALIAALLLWLVFHLETGNSNRIGKATAFATLTSGFVVAQLSFGIWQGWWQVTLWLAAALTTAVVYRRS